MIHHQDGGNRWLILVTMTLFSRSPGSLTKCLPAVYLMNLYDKDCRKFVKLSFVCTLSGANKIDCTKVTISTFFFPHFSLWCIDHERRIGRKSCSKNKIIKNGLTRIWTGDLLFTSQASYHRRLVFVFWNKGRQSILNKAVVTCTLESSVENGWLFPVTKYMLHVYSLLIIPILLRFICSELREGNPVSIQTGLSVVITLENGLLSPVTNKWYVYCWYHYILLRFMCFETWEGIHFQKKKWGGKEGGKCGRGSAVRDLLVENGFPPHSIVSYIRAPSSEFVSSSIPSWQILTAHAQPFRGARDLAFCLKVPLDSLLVWASSGGSGETARMRRLAWTFAARIGNKYQIRLTRPI